MKLTTIHNIFKRAIPLQTLLRSSLSFSVKSFFMLSSFGSKYLHHFVNIFFTKNCFTSAIYHYIKITCDTYCLTSCLQNLLSFLSIFTASPRNGLFSIHFHDDPLFLTPLAYAQQTKQMWFPSQFLQLIKTIIFIQFVNTL